MSLRFKDPMDLLDLGAKSQPSNETPKNNTETQRNNTTTPSMLDSDNFQEGNTTKRQDNTQAVRVGSKRSTAAALFMWWLIA